MRSVLLIHLPWFLDFQDSSISFQLCSTVSFRLTLFGRLCSSLFGLARKNYVSGRWRPHMNWCCYLQNHFVESWRFLWHIFSLDSLTRYTQCWITKTVITGCIDYVGCFSHCFFSILFCLLLSFILRSLSAFSSLSSFSIIYLGDARCVILCVDEYRCFSPKKIPSIAEKNISNGKKKISFTRCKESC